MDQSQYVNSEQISKAGSSIRRWKTAGIALIVLVGMVYAAAVGYMYLNQRTLLFKPSGVLPEPSAVGLADVDVSMVSMADGTELTVWSACAATKDAPTVLFFHGQSGNLGDRADRLKEILNSGYGLLAPSYRGYPESSGTPSEMALISDGLELFDQLDRAGERIVLHGQSLGTAVAAAVAAQRPTAELLVLEAPFTATVDVAAERHPWLPVSALMKDHFATRDIITEIDVPTLIFHGTDDETVPMHHGKPLLNWPKTRFSSI
ncbi:alpha/beta hydrolase [uncultured Ruegeria sp.]|uniref:alpha/beta hydrolase n=1 Tax=uncultured Ruegeria sp. TaxID=259304 RepID=UPI00260FC121|nr:alpha/beta hydrolase [uncultured Ruegeria sp.]